MATMFDLIARQLDVGTVESMAARVGATPEQTATVVESALPALLGALQRNAGTAAGESALAAALDRDHDGSLLDHLGPFIEQGPSAADVRSLDHIFGGRRGTVESTVARRSGLDARQVTRIIAMLAPLVLAALSRARQQQPQPRAPQQGGTGGDLGDVLGGALGRMQEGAPGLGGVLGGLLDSDQDGSILDDLLEKGLGSARASRAGTSSSGGGDVLGGILGGLLGGGRRH